MSIGSNVHHDPKSLKLVSNIRGKITICKNMQAILAGLLGQILVLLLILRLLLASDRISPFTLARHKSPESMDAHISKLT